MREISELGLRNRVTLLAHLRQKLAWTGLRSACNGTTCPTRAGKCPRGRAHMHMSFHCYLWWCRWSACHLHTCNQHVNTVMTGSIIETSQVSSRCQWSGVTALAKFLHTVRCKCQKGRSGVIRRCCVPLVRLNTMLRSDLCQSVCKGKVNACCSGQVCRPSVIATCLHEHCKRRPG